MSFAVAAEAYDRFMGRFSVPLATVFADFVGVEPGQRALDVGCGTGAFTAELVRRLGASAVAAVDPSPPFVSAMRARFPDVEVRAGSTERLPFDDSDFDVVAAQLVVHFMTDPVAGLKEMSRVARPGGTVATCVWDHAGGTGPLATFWQAVRRVDPAVPDESHLPGAREGELAKILAAAGLGEVEEALLSVTVAFADFDDWWDPFELGVGPAGAYVAGLDETARQRLREECRGALPTGSFSLLASAWTTRGRA